VRVNRTESEERRIRELYEAEVAYARLIFAGVFCATASHVLATGQFPQFEEYWTLVGKEQT
jgi:hypothetical protein